MKQKNLFEREDIRDAALAVIEADAKNISPTSQHIIAFIIMGWLLYPKSKTSRKLTTKTLSFERFSSHADTLNYENISKEWFKSFAIYSLNPHDLLDVLTKGARPKSLHTWLGKPKKGSSTKGVKFRQPKIWNAFMFSLVSLLYPDIHQTTFARNSEKKNLAKQDILSPKRTNQHDVEKDINRYRKILPLVFGTVYGIRLHNLPTNTGRNLTEYQDNLQLTLEAIEQNLPTILKLAVWFEQNWKAKPDNTYSILKSPKVVIPTEWEKQIKADFEGLPWDKFGLKLN